MEISDVEHILVAVEEQGSVLDGSMILCNDKDIAPSGSNVRDNYTRANNYTRALACNPQSLKGGNVINTIQKRKSKIRIDDCADPDQVYAIMSSRKLEGENHIQEGIVLRPTTRQSSGVIVESAHSPRVSKAPRKIRAKEGPRSVMKVEHIQDTIIVSSTAQKGLWEEQVASVRSEEARDVSPTAEVGDQFEKSLPETGEKRGVRKRELSKDSEAEVSLKIKKEKIEEDVALCDENPAKTVVNGTDVPSLAATSIPHYSVEKQKSRKEKKRDGRGSLETIRKRNETRRRRKAEKEQAARDLAMLHVKSDNLLKSADMIKPRARSVPAHVPQQRARKEAELSITTSPRLGQPLVVRALSERPRLTRSELKKRRGKSAPPSKIRFTADHKLNLLDQKIDFAPSESRKRRAYSVGAFPEAPEALFHTRQLALEIARPLLKRKAKEAPTSKKPRKKAVAVIATRKEITLKHESSGKIISAANKNKTTMVDISDSDINLSDALDLSDGDTTVREDGLPLSFPEKLSRAESRPKLGLFFRHSISKPPQVKLRSLASKTSLDNKDGEYDSRYHPSALCFEEGNLMIPASCNRCSAKRQFCDRNMPCWDCARTGHQCERKDGKFPARKRYNCQKEKSDAEIVSKPVSVEIKASASPDGLDSPESVVKSTKLKAREVKKRMSTAITPRGGPECIWVERPHPQAHKPYCVGNPEVWCTNRQELCESLPYFRSYQSGTYHSGGVMHGYLADGCAGPRDFMNGRIVISHGGGKSSTDEDGSRKLMSSQFETGTGIRDLLNNLRGKWPLVIIMGDQCVTSPSKIPHRYCVMDWFKVTAAWAERDVHTSHVRWMFRFEKLDSSKLGWWASPHEVYHPSETIDMLKACCLSCREESPWVYEQGWMCLKPQCVNFWKLNGQNPPLKLNYAQSFINCHTPWDLQLELPPAPLRPPLTTSRDNYYDGGDVARVYWKGMCCPQCGRLNCREYWTGWACKNCGFKSSPPRTIFEADRLADPHRSIFTGPAIPSNIVQPGITWTRTVKDGMTCLIYHLKSCGTVTHILASESHNKRPECADWLFREYQSPDMPFRRYPLKSHRVQGQLLTQQFSFNAGAPYKYIVAVDSTPFEKSPRVVTRSLELIQERVRLVHPESEFNEILSVGYFEGQRMDFHDDGEEELGDTVASISLGAPARMKFRVKAKYMSDYHLGGLKTAPKQVKIEPGLTQDATIVKEAHPEHDDAEEEREDEEARPPCLVSKTNIQKESRVKLELKLNHGDVVVMKGREIQRIWEHAVQPIGLFRIAATARWINVPTSTVENPKKEVVAMDGATISGEEKTSLYMANELPMPKSVTQVLPLSPVIDFEMDTTDDSQCSSSSSQKSSLTDETLLDVTEPFELRAKVVENEKENTEIYPASNFECASVGLSTPFNNSGGVGCAQLSETPKAIGESALANETTPKTHKLQQESTQLITNDYEKKMEHTGRFYDGMEEITPSLEFV